MLLGTIQDIVSSVPHAETIARSFQMVNIGTGSIVVSVNGGNSLNNIPMAKTSSTAASLSLQSCHHLKFTAAILPSLLFRNTLYRDIYVQFLQEAALRNVKISSSTSVPYASYQNQETATLNYKTLRIQSQTLYTSLCSLTDATTYKIVANTETMAVGSGVVLPSISMPAGSTVYIFFQVEANNGVYPSARWAIAMQSTSGNIDMYSYLRGVNGSTDVVLSTGADIRRDAYEESTISSSITSYQSTYVAAQFFATSATVFRAIAAPFIELNAYQKVQHNSAFYNIPQYYRFAVPQAFATLEYTNIFIDTNIGCNICAYSGQYFTEMKAPRWQNCSQTALAVLPKYIGEDAHLFIRTTGYCTELKVSPVRRLRSGVTTVSSTMPYFSQTYFDLENSSIQNVTSFGLSSVVSGFFGTRHTYTVQAVSKTDRQSTTTIMTRSLAGSGDFSFTWDNVTRAMPFVTRDSFARDYTLSFVMLAVDTVTHSVTITLARSYENTMADRIENGEILYYIVSANRLSAMYLPSFRVTGQNCVPQLYLGVGQKYPTRIEHRYSDTSSISSRKTVSVKLTAQEQQSSIVVGVGSFNTRCDYQLVVESAPRVNSTMFIRPKQSATQFISATSSLIASPFDLVFELQSTYHQWNVSLVLDSRSLVRVLFGNLRSSIANSPILAAIQAQLNAKINRGSQIPIYLNSTTLLVFGMDPIATINSTETITISSTLSSQLVLSGDDRITSSNSLVFVASAAPTRSSPATPKASSGNTNSTKPAIVINAGSNICANVWLLLASLLVLLTAPINF